MLPGTNCVADLPYNLHASWETSVMTDMNTSTNQQMYPIAESANGKW